MGVMLFFLGVIAYSFIEYAVHRWVLHGPMRKQHSGHHRNPSKDAQVPIMLVVPVLGLLLVLSGPSLTFGVLVCWFCSGLLHRSLHTNDPKSPWALKLQEHHLGHHRRAGTNYGVSSVLWDRLFGTLDTNSLKS